MVFTLESIAMENFKGVKNATYTFDGNMIVDGRNGSGKTTVSDAHFWLWVDKDSDLVSNPPIRNKDDYSANPCVTEVVTIDGKRITVKKFQTLNEKTGATPNSYKIGNVSKTKKEFDAYFAELGLDMTKFLYLSNPFAFMGQTTKGMRELLFSMAKGKSDLEIAKKLKLKEVSELLEEHTAVDVAKIAKNTIDEIDSVHGKKGEITATRIEEREKVSAEIHDFFEACLKDGIDIMQFESPNKKALESLNTLYREYEQRKADAEKIQYQLGLISSKKNDLLVKSINKCFKHVSWRLWVESKNGTVKDDCTPMIDGYTYGESTNHGRQILAQADIVYSLQRYFNLYLPVFMDDLESLDEDKYPLQDKTQLIALVRRPKDFEIRKMVEE